MRSKFPSINGSMARAVAALLAFTLTGAAAGQDVAPASAPSPATVVVNFNQSRGAFVHPERYNNLSRARTFAAQRDADVQFFNANGLHGRIYKVWVDAQAIHNPATGAYDYSSVADYLDDVSRLSDSLLMVMDTRVLIRDRKETPEQIKPVIRTIMRDLKQRFPQIKYIEAFNEPDYNLAKSIKPEQLYDYYRVYYEAVNEINRELKPKVPLQVGGPAFMMYNEEWLRAFLDRFKADPASDKRLDFISWHGYGYFEQGGGAPGQLRPYHFFKGNPSEVAGQRAELERELGKRGLDTRVPAFITETGIYPGPSFDHPNDPRPDYLIAAAGVLSLHYWYMEQPRTFPFNWVLRHATEERKDELVTRPGKGQPPLTNTFTPYGNALAMMAKLKDERVGARSDALSEGKGVYAIATKDASGAAVMVWNYQHVGTRSYRTRIDFGQLPPNLRGKALRQRIFRIDDKLSNYWGDPARANLQQISRSVLPPHQRHSITIELTPNALELIVLEPVSGRTRDVP